MFRIIFGAFLLFYFGVQLPHVAMLYSREGLLMPMFSPDAPLTVIFTPPPSWAAHVLFLSFLGALFFFTIGLLTRVSTAVSFILYVYYWFLSLFHLGASFDHLFLFTLLVMAFSGCGKTFSVDIRIRSGSWTAWEPISILPQRLLAVQITMTYLGVGWQKIVLPDWQSGEILVHGFIGRWATAPAYAIVRMNIPLSLYDAVTWLIKAFEVSLPFGLWHPRTRWWFIAGGTLFHISIAILLSIWWFLALIPAYILFFTPPAPSPSASGAGRGGVFHRVMELILWLPIEEE